jgi:hypothetical protein
VIVLRLLGTLVWFGISAGLLTYTVHDLDVRDAPTYGIEGTVVGHRQVHHEADQDSTAYTTYFITVRSATEDFEFGDRNQDVDTEPGTQVVVQVSKATEKIVFLRKNDTLVDLRSTVGDDVGMIVIASIGLLIALVREALLDPYDFPRWAGFLLGVLSAGGGVWLGLVLAS